MEEIWLPVKDFESQYLVSNTGKVFSIKHKREKVLQDCRGYKIVNLCKNGKVNKKQVHRLVAEAFISNPNNLPQVNHKDENRSNNNVDNLEWCTAKYNCNYGTRNKKLSEINTGIKRGIPISEEHKKHISENSPRNKTVFQYKMNGEFVACYRSTREAARQINRVSQGPISQNANRKFKQSYGYIWRYKDDENNEFIDNTPIEYTLLN